MILLTSEWADIPTEKNLLILNSSRFDQTIYIKTASKRSRKTIPAFSHARVYVTGEKMQMKNDSKSVTVEVEE